MDFTRSIYPVALSKAELATLPEAVAQAEAAYKQASATSQRLTVRRNNLLATICDSLFELPAEQVAAARAAHVLRPAFEKAEVAMHKAGEVVSKAWDAVLSFYDIKHLGENEQYPYLSLRPEPVEQGVATAPWTHVSTPPTRTSDYLVGWCVPADEVQDEPAFAVHLVACYSTELAAWDGPAHRYQLWMELPKLPCPSA